MWISSRPLNALVRPRPARIVYLVPESPPHVLLDVLIDESLSRWGGRRTPIVPTNGISITPAYWSFLNLWDADIIYSYVALSDELLNRITHTFAPSEVRLHERMAEREDRQTLRPDHGGNLQFLSSLSLLPLFARRSQVVDDQLPAIIDKEMGVTVGRDLADSFGFVSSGNYVGSLLPYARRVSLQPEADQRTAQHPQKGVSYVENDGELIHTILRGGSLTLSRLSDTLCPHLLHLARGREGWDDHLTIVVGDEGADRLLFWNAQHRYSALGTMNDLPVLRLSPDRFRDEVPEWLKNWVSRHNDRHLNGNGAPRTVLRSCSLTKEQLDTISGSLGDRRMVMLSSEHHADPCVFDSCERHISENRRGLTAAFPSTWAHAPDARRMSVRFENNELDLPLVPPWHIRDVQAAGLTDGVWAVDLCVERAEDHSPFSNRRHVWNWPRRVRLEQAVDYTSAHPSLILPPQIRPTEYGDLTVWDCASWDRPILHFPRDYQAFVLAVERLVPGSAEERNAIAVDGPRARFEVTISDKGRDLLGVFQFFQSLPEALAFLTDRFWLDVIHYLSPQEPADNRRNIKDLAQRISEIGREEELDAGYAERLARRALSLAVRSLTSQRELSKSISFRELLKRAKQVEKQGQAADIEKRLIRSVTYLRDRGFLWQGYGWTCSFCQHPNWVPLDRLSAVLSCEICRRPESSPVYDGLYFRLNPFVQHAFSSTSAQGPVIWCLDQLARRATWSFAFVPALDLYRPRKESRESDVDLLATVDGQVYVVEVKSSFAGVEAEAFEQLKHMAQELRPDILMLAVPDRDENSAKTAEIEQLFESQLAACDVRFELLTLDRARTGSLYSPFGAPTSKRMSWSAW